MRKIKVLVLALTIMAMGIVPAMAQDDPGTIADIVVASASSDAPEFTTLLAAVQAADPAVLEALSDPEAEFTVFAPTDKAFGDLVEALGEDAFNEILADPAALAGILTFHVVEGKIMSSDVVAALEENDGYFGVQSVNGQYIDIYQDMGSIYIDDAALNMDMLDIEASNGVIHVIDAVMLPESATIADMVIGAATAMDTPEFTTLLAAVQAADPAVLEALSDPEAELTVFAPTDAAFEALGEDTINAVLADTELLTGILLYHVVPGAVYSGDVAALFEANEGMFEAETLQGASATFELTEDGIMIDGAMIVSTDFDAVNGVIHIIDAVILPPSE